MNRIYIDKTLDLALHYKDRIIGIKDLEESELKSIYRARVEKIIKNQNIGFLKTPRGTGIIKLYKEELINEGDNLLVQVKKLPEGDKYPILSREISLEGKYLIYFPRESFVKLSSKIIGKDKKWIYDLVKEKDMKGLLIRSSLTYERKEEFLKEYENLKKLGENILLEENLLPVPKLIYDFNELDGFFNNRDFEDIITNNKDIYKKYKNTYKISLDEGFRIIYEDKLIRDYKNLFEKKVDLLCGGNILIEKTEALTAIDVNSANFSQGLNKEEFIYKVNESAAIEIARQVILRNISGIILIDFINMNNKQYRDNILKILERELNKDYSKSKIHGYTKLGLVEISRKNFGKELINKIGE
ncbi:ribonuclease E/G [Peptoniphilus catoniae]|uniref:ribonuclease E/G n=1 Tax=Peptoniphilus catoniae TaxID=1660341 RepID=UPI0010FF40C1|nr:ribonuclease E/G [Peptoniphilus catoniae]